MTAGVVVLENDSWDPHLFVHFYPHGTGVILGSLWGKQWYEFKRLASSLICLPLACVLCLMDQLLSGRPRREQPNGEAVASYQQPYETHEVESPAPVKSSQTAAPAQVLAAASQKTPSKNHPAKGLPIPDLQRPRARIICCVKLQNGGVICYTARAD